MGYLAGDPGLLDPPPDTPQVLVMLVGSLRSLEEPPVVLAAAVLLRPRPESLTGLVGVTFGSADRPLAQSDGLLLRRGGHAHERPIQAKQIEAEVLFQEPEEFVVNAVVAGAASEARVPGGFVR